MSENNNVKAVSDGLATEFGAKTRRRRVSLDARKARAGYLFVLPFILGVILIYLPILIDSICFSFNEIGTEIVIVWINVDAALLRE